MANAKRAARRHCYTVNFELDADRYWSAVANLGRNKSAISDGQTLPKARRRIRQAIALALNLEDEEAFDIREVFELPLRTKAILGRYQELRERTLREQAELNQATRRAAELLTKLGVSRRDTGDLLGISGARVQQVLAKS